MYPQLIAAASRLGPMMERLGARAGSFMGPGMRASQIQIPQPTPMPVDGPSPPISTDNSGSPGVPSTPSPPPAPPYKMTYEDVVTPGPNDPSALDTAQWPAGPKGAPVASANEPSPLDTARWPAGPVGAPPGALSSAMGSSAPERMGFFERNSAMMRDPTSGDFIDPAAGARAEAATGPDLIQNMMTYLHRKRSA